MQVRRWHFVASKKTYGELDVYTIRCLEIQIRRNVEMSKYRNVEM